MDAHGYRVGANESWWPTLPDDEQEIEAMALAARRHIEPWLSAVFQAEHLNLLIGSGFASAVSYLAKVKATGMDFDPLGTELDDGIKEEATKSAKTMGRGAPNIEDQFIGDNEKLSFSDWLGDYIGADHAQNGSVAVVDLSLVPSEIVHIVVAVLGRLVFEALQRYRRLHPEGRTLPTTIVLEEAHSFIRKGREDDLSSAAALCRETFERIAREGRKFGLGMVLSSQRPSELSATVLAQCNTFLLHRIVNDVDQDLIRRLVPDNVGGLLKDLPSLPSRQAVLLGWATPMPILVEMAELPESQRPHSADPDFWEVWTGVQERKIDWKTIADDWAGDVPSQEAEEESED
ncbi:ATP-binding protein [Xanthomonas campestris pv. campestris]|uniref:ATP-binding protein n=1 Tax=Xanthomonas campestris TaxID=339 RepID=UPI00265C8672|nr:ATP-binding protein [Xanthomonas campestris]MDO0791306.1 ATP-binding protein [Xanthomonas campestris pv. campestris]MDO0840192.1 ATP-binding protein [Xanthomonas campestris pv. campestris]MEB1349856.1 ATP-binding protein [Xanthomonas campestris pv. campestris]